MAPARLLVIGTETATLCDVLRVGGFDVAEATDVAEAIHACSTFAPDVAMVDFEQEATGVELVRRLRACGRPPAIVVVTSPGGAPPVVELLKSGAVGRVAKPLCPDEVMVVVAKALDVARLEREVRALHANVRTRVSRAQIVGSAPAMHHALELVDQVAATQATVLITGEFGTGKELIANALHERSRRAGGPFVTLHCNGLADWLIDDELFGHEPGACPGAIGRRDGRLALASGGTLFLDDVAEIPLGTQVKLMRFVQEHAFERLGGDRTLAADTRLIAATERDLLAEVTARRFREDLYYRLSVVAIELPPLHQRRCDIPELARLFVRRCAAAAGKSLEDITPEALDLLDRYDWPGNVRELELLIERVVAVAAGPRIEAHHVASSLPPLVTAPKRYPVVPGATMAEIERFAILETMKATGGSPSRAADILRISARTIQYRMHEYSAASEPGEPTACDARAK
jgi:DNA-binding NtrC family response regulator